MDRSAPNIPKSQSGFLEYLVKPLYEAFTTQFPSTAQAFTNMKENLAMWNEKLKAQEN